MRNQLYLDKNLRDFLDVALFYQIIIFLTGKYNILIYFQNEESKKLDMP